MKEPNNSYITEVSPDTPASNESLQLNYVDAEMIRLLAQIEKNTRKV